MFSTTGWSILLLNLVSIVVPLCSADPDEYRNTSEIIRSRGFVSEEHDVVTSDGFILTIFRIKNPNFDRVGKPVLLMHPLLSESSAYLINSGFGFVNESTSEVGNNLGFELAKRDKFDVWLANVRGNTYGLKHRNLTKSDKRFWEFSFDEHAAYDIPAIIQYIQNQTAQQKIDFVGHSQGTAVMFALLSRHPDFAQNIDHFIAMAPIAYVGKLKSPVSYLFNSFPFRRYLNWSPGAFLPSNTILQPFAHLFCPHSLTSKLCTNVLFLICGYDANQLDKLRIPVMVAHAPAGTSKQNMLHFIQLMGTAKFRMFDHGPNKNMDTYGTSEPPEYNVSQITHPKISFLWSMNDALATPTSVQFLREKLTVKLVDDYKIPIKEFNHLDFLWGRDAGKYVNSKVLEILQRSD